LSRKPRWTAKADDRFYEIIDYISERNLIAAYDMAHTLRSCVYPALDHPALYREGIDPGTREIVAHPNYIVVYEYDDEWLTVLDVRHTSKLHPPE
jgi:plasmid stabilization system protein ParE